MDDRTTLLQNLKQPVELDQAAGIEFMLREPANANPAATTNKKTAPIVAPAPSPVAPPSTPQPTVTPVAQLPSTPVTNDTLTAIAHDIAACKACGLCDGRRNTVPGEGHPNPTLLFVGEGPGADEDAQGRPFVGAAGQLLDKMIVAMGLSRDQVFIANVIKCRPPGNRTPEFDEVNACLHFLERQIAVLKPTVICALGNTPLRALTGNDKAGITRMRGQQLSYRGITMIPTFHPSFLLRNADAKKPCWEDLQTVLKVMGREPPKRG